MIEQLSSIASASLSSCWLTVVATAEKHLRDVRCSMADTKAVRHPVKIIVALKLTLAKDMTAV
jgi:hypothetical protein